MMQYRCQDCEKAFVRKRQQWPRSPRKPSYVAEPTRPLEREAPEPQVIHRQCGGYLAISPKGCAIKIGVTDATEEAVLAKFSKTYARWVEILDEPPSRFAPTLHNR